MNPAFTLTLDDGAVQIEGCAVRIEPGLTKAAAANAFARFYKSAVDHKNGYEWIYLDGLSFGGVPGAMALCFHEGLIREINWSADAPGGQLEDGWPTQEAIDREIAFVRRVLAKLMGEKTFSGHRKFAWGELWSTFDAKGFTASSGLRYKAGAAPA
ncbi:hypothetical protein DFR24_0109 [Panacagrimonas perspica]|uniref:Uncharacterized protein n=1 Tax=Panacagrimonas perspica TaxID=381431 RepID=A0A4R7P9S2_9GAMM|nr:hypothetical protein [Panacagrimonas perspica]TDU30755.1 hypothetical protein DFR24_0109 [Panacagrimonas perspica]THD01573.1 hypothetical protein B1810_18855 [Panacagrimonas perspica]